VKGAPRLYEVLPTHAAFVARLRRIVETDDRGDLEAWIGVAADADRPIFAQLLGGGPLRDAIRKKALAECLREVYSAPNRLFDDRLRDDAGDDPAVKLLVDDPSLPFHLRAPGEIAGRTSGAARKAAASALEDSRDLVEFVAALRAGEGEVILAAL
jgi:hypothetical protein